MPRSRPPLAPRRGVVKPPLVSSIVAAALVALVAPIVALGDDTDIYAPPIDAEFEPTLMFVVDTSGSMRLEDGGWLSGWRRDRLLEPLIDFVRTAEGVRAGLASFNGSGRGGAVLQAADDLDRDLCPDARCGSITVRARVARDDDDGHEDIDSGRVSLTTALTTVGEIIDDGGFSSFGVAAPDNAVVEAGGTGPRPAESLMMFRNAAGETTRVGLHFPNVELPAGVEIERVNLVTNWFGHDYLDPDAGEGSGVARARIGLDARERSPSFADVAGRRVGDRPRVPGHVDWEVRRPEGWENAAGDSTPTLKSPDLTSLFRAAHTPGTPGSVTVMIEPSPTATIDAVNAVSLLGVNSRPNHISPRLMVSYRDPNKPRPRFINGHRFDGLDVPRGARIISAHMELDARLGGSDWHDLELRAEASGDAAPFARAARALSSRALVDGAVRWRSETPWNSEERVRTPDLAALVQQVVSRDDWCAGNALAVLTRGEGERRILTHDRGPLHGAALHVTYDPTSVGAAGPTCRAQPVRDALLLASEADVVQRANEPPRTLSTFETVRNRPYLGLRFGNVNLGPDDEIAEAVLTLATVGSPKGATRLEVGIDGDTPGVAFDDAATDLIARTRGEPRVSWYSERLTDGSRITSVDLAPLVRHALADPAWRRGADIVLTVRRTGGSHVSVATSRSGVASGPTLRIARRLRGSEALELPLATPRDRLVERLQALPAAGETPLLDAFFETAQYLTGGEVVHGRRRGEQQPQNVVHRLSDSGAWTQGTVHRPLGCDADAPDAPACIGETIEGSPVYTAPSMSECRANQLVLVTDGDPTPGPTDTAARIRALAGVPTCEDPSGGAACATDLARWLATGTEGRPPVRVNTIGFAFDSELLGRVADAGGGRAVSVSSDGGLDDALLEIAHAADSDAVTLTGPALSVSQFNRSTHRDDVYLGLFESAVLGTPWPGNLKRYALGTLPDGGFGLLDAQGRPAVDPDTGQFSPSARSWWSAAADGAAVTVGGAASRLPTARRVLTWPAPSTGNDHGVRTLVAFDEANDAIEASDLGVAAEDRAEAIRWMRGLDVRDVDDDGVTDEARHSMGAAIHTTPVVVDYASGDPEGRSVVFAGTQEGFLHGIDTATGRELFAFLPFELYGNVGSLVDPRPGPMLHGLDGPVTSWTSDENRNGVVDPGESAFVTVGMRRGGSHYYTLDVSDPDAPSLAWTIDPGRKGFEALRQSWSAMRQARLRVDPDTSADGAAVRPALVFTSGYDPVDDARGLNRLGATRRDRRANAAIYLVDPRTGELLHRVTDRRLNRSIPSDVAVVDVDLDGLTDLLLVGDVGGRLLRVDLTPSTANDGSSTGTALALSIPWWLSGRRGSGAHDRRFFHAPDVALLSDGSAPPTLGVAIGSGRRDHPLGTSTQDRLYALSLDPTAPDRHTRRERHLHDATDIAPDPGGRGWFIDLERAGEKILGSPVIVDGRIVVTSYVPSAGAGDPCEPKLGSARLYSLDAFDASPSLADPSTSGDEPVRSIELTVPGIPPPVTVVLNAARPGAPAVMAGAEFVVDAAGPVPARERTYWVSD